MKFTLHPARPADAAWLYSVRRATMRGYVEDMFGHWDDDAQRARFHVPAELANMQIIRVDGRSAGLLHVERGLEDIFLANIQIEPRFQNLGLGSAVIRSLLAEGRQQRRPVRLQVLKTNPAARALYDRLGFVQSGETPEHVLMIWRPD